jgi:zinc finger CCHC domain-containing protein 9
VLNIIISLDKLPYAKCYVCDGTGHLAGQCPKNEKGMYPNGGSCRFCGKVDHLARDCKMTKEEAGTSVVGKIDLSQGADDDDFHIFVEEKQKFGQQNKDEKDMEKLIEKRKDNVKKKVVKF